MTPFPGKAQALGWSGHMAALPAFPGTSVLVVQAQMGIYPTPHVKELTGRGSMAGCVYMYVHIYVYIYLYI